MRFETKSASRDVTGSTNQLATVASLFAQIIKTKLLNPTLCLVSWRDLSTSLFVTRQESQEHEERIEVRLSRSVLITIKLFAFAVVYRYRNFDFRERKKGEARKNNGEKNKQRLRLSGVRLD